MKKLSSIIIEHPIQVIVAFIITTIALGIGMGSLETRNSFDGELPASDPINVDIYKIKSVYGDRSLVMLGLAHDDLFSIQGFDDIRSLTEQVADIRDVMPDEVLSLATAKNISKKSWGMESTGFLDEYPSTVGEWSVLKEDVYANDMIRGTLISADDQLAVIIAPLADDFVGGDVYASLQDIKQSYEGIGAIHITGAPILVEDVQQGIGKDSKRFISIAILLVFLGFYLCFRSWAGVLLPLIMVVMSIIWTMGTMGYLGLDITVVSNALPVIMIAVASSYGIHFMNAYFELSGHHDDKRSLVQATLDKIGLPIAITGLTSALGSLSLLVFKIVSLREFGIIGCVGFTYATIICLGLMPAMAVLIKVKARPRAKTSIINSFCQNVTNWVLNHRAATGAIYCIVLPLSLWFASQISIGDDYIKFFPEQHSGRVAAELFNDKLDGVRVMDIMVDTEDADGIKASDFYKQLAQFESQLESLTHVGGVHSYTDVVDHIAKNIANTDENHDLSDAEIAQYLMLHEMSATPGEVEGFRDAEYQTAHLRVLLNTSNPEDHEVVHLKAQSLASTHFGDKAIVSYGGDVMHRIALGHYIVKGKIQNIILALIIVLLTTHIIFRSIRKGLFTLIPIICSLIMVFGFMGLIGIRLGISTSLLTAMIVGIGIDFSIHYLVSYYRQIEHGSQKALSMTSGTTGKAITYDALSNILGFSVLSLSGFLPVQHFGWLLAFSMLLIFVNTLVIFPLMFGLRVGPKVNTKPVMIAASAS